jgi:hypothetical protein
MMKEAMHSMTVPKIQPSLLVLMVQAKPSTDFRNSKKIRGYAHFPVSGRSNAPRENIQKSLAIFQNRAMMGAFVR